MLPKPSTCIGCPRYGTGKGFVPDTLVPGSTLLVMQMAPSPHDALGDKVIGYDGKVALFEKVTPAPMIGYIGYQIRTTYLPLTKVAESSTSFASLLKCYSKDTSTIKSALKCCRQYMAAPNNHVRVIVAHGGDTFEALQPELVAIKPGVRGKDDRQKGGVITAWRGFYGPQLLNNTPVMAVQHIQDFWKNPAMRVPARLDWKRVGKLLRGEWPLPIPPRAVVGEPHTDIQATFDEAMATAKFVAIDTEFNRYTKFLNMCGIGWVRYDGTVGGIQIRWVGDEHVTTEARSLFIRCVRRLVGSKPVVFHNAKADIPVIEQAFHIGYSAYTQIEDTMQAHACLWSEMPHSLDFCASIYGQYQKLKHLEASDPLLYNWGDVIETSSTWGALEGELSKNLSVLNVYRNQNMRLLPLTMRREALGLRIDQDALRLLTAEYTEKVRVFDAWAEAYAGYPLNLNSSGATGQLARHLKAYEDLALVSVDEATISEARDEYLPFDRAYEEREGFSEAYLKERIEQGANALLELRAARTHYGHALSQDLLPLVGKERVYPTYSIHAQESGRWSTVRPAMAKVPVEFLKLFVPNPGHILFGFDWDAQEPRIFMAEAKSEFLRKAFDEKLDIHTMLCCDMFNWPKPPNLQNPHTSPECHDWRQLVGWEGKEDKRRTVAKNVRYERYYMGSGYMAIAKAVKVGVSRSAMERASKLVMMQDPNVGAFHRMILKQAQTGRIYTWAGRLRVFLGQGKAVAREMCNQKMQGGGADLLNLTLIEAYDKHPCALMAYTRHDSIMWEIPLTMFTPDLARTLREIVEQPRLINGMPVKFPASFKTMDEHGVTAHYSFTEGT